MLVLLGNLGEHLDDLKSTYLGSESSGQGKAMEEPLGAEEGSSESLGSRTVAALTEGARAVAACVSVARGGADAARVRQSIGAARGSAWWCSGTIAGGAQSRRLGLAGAVAAYETGHEHGGSNLGRKGGGCGPIPLDRGEWAQGLVVVIGRSSAGPRSQLEI